MLMKKVNKNTKQKLIKYLTKQQKQLETIEPKLFSNDRQQLN